LKLARSPHSLGATPSRLYLLSRKSHSSIETRSFPTLARRYPSRASMLVHRGIVREYLIQKGEQAATPAGDDKICQTHGSGKTPVNRRFNKKMIRLFLIGMLCGVMTMAAVTLVFAIPANDYHWRMEIWKRGGTAWTVDKNGHFGWRWMIEPVSNTAPPKRVIVPSSETNVRSERL
jgi:hypothetical protein